MKKVEYTAETLPPLTDTQKTALRHLDVLPEAEIDTREIPELTDDQLAEARRGRFYRPVKQQITARLDADVVAWLKSKGKGYQTRMNAILRLRAWRCWRVWLSSRPWSRSSRRRAICR